MVVVANGLADVGLCHRQREVNRFGSKLRANPTELLFDTAASGGFHLSGTPLGLSQDASSLGLGVAVIFVLGLTVPLNWCIQKFILAPGALAWAGMPDSDLSYLQFLTFIATIAAAVQLVEMAVDKLSPKLYAALGIFLPLIAVNCAILGSSMFMVERGYTFSQSVVYGLSSGTGWLLAILSMAAIRWKLRTAHVPGPLKGLGITFITTGLIAMAFMTFSGI